jgi:hypothetical protein
LVTICATGPINGFLLLATIRLRGHPKFRLPKRFSRISISPTAREKFGIFQKFPEISVAPKWPVCCEYSLESGTDFISMSDRLNQTPEWVAARQIVLAVEQWAGKMAAQLNVQPNLTTKQKMSGAIIKREALSWWGLSEKQFCGLKSNNEHYVSLHVIEKHLARARLCETTWQIGPQESIDPGVWTSKRAASRYDSLCKEIIEVFQKLDANDLSANSNQLEKAPKPAQLSKTPEAKRSANPPPELRLADLVHMDCYIPERNAESEEGVLVTISLGFDDHHFKDSGINYRIVLDRCRLRLSLTDATATAFECGPQSDVNGNQIILMARTSTPRTPLWWVEGKGSGKRLEGSYEYFGFTLLKGQRLTSDSATLTTPKHGLKVEFDDGAPLGDDTQEQRILEQWIKNTKLVPPAGSLGEYELAFQKLVGQNGD